MQVRPRSSLARLARGLAAAILGLCASVAHATSIVVAIDTSALSGTNAILVFRFVDGGAPANQVVIAGFTTDALLGAASTTGGVSGALPGTVTLDDTVVLSELAQHLALAQFVDFSVDPTANAPGGGSSPDMLAIYLLDEVTALPLFSTSDPSGADALIVFEITGGELGQINLYQPTSFPAATVVIAIPNGAPLPATSWLVVAAAMALGWSRRRPDVRQEAAARVGMPI
jgi:hypothetical protein